MWYTGANCSGLCVQLLLRLAINGQGEMVCVTEKVKKFVNGGGALIRTCDLTAIIPLPHRGEVWVLTTDGDSFDFDFDIFWQTRHFHTGTGREAGVMFRKEGFIGRIHGGEVV